MSRAARGGAGMSRAAMRSDVFAESKRRLRERSEHVLRLAAMEDVARRYPGRTVPSALQNEGPFWRLVFVPLYRRVPWEFKRNAMRRLKMTARGWPEQSRQFGEPWRPPARGSLTPPGNGSTPHSAV